MKTRVCRLHGRNDLRIETEEVAAPGEGEVLVSIAAGGICGSDIHYLANGGIGTIRVREPIILGHEASGRVIAVGDGVPRLKEGDPVALNPSRPCGRCAYCAEGLPMHCLRMRFNGSAIRLPHEQGFFRDRVAVGAAQCVPLPQGADLGAAACAEPLAVCLHAANMAGEISGKRALVTGAGPIGVYCAAVAAERGAAEIVVTDLQDAPLAAAARMGATRTINVSTHGSELGRFAGEKGYFHLAFECSASASAIEDALSALRPRGVLVQVGVAGDTPLPINALVAKEIRIQGTHRFHEEFPEAVEAIASGRIDAGRAVTARYPLEEAAAAFASASDRSRSVKVQLTFEGS